MKTFLFASGAAFAAVLLTSAPAIAADDPDAATKAQTESIKAQTELTKAETEKFKAEKAAFDAKWGALNLPTQEGKVTLGEGAGKMEAIILSATAMNAAATEIASRNPFPPSAPTSEPSSAGEPPAAGASTSVKRKVLVLSDAETVDFGLAKTLAVDLDALTIAAGAYVCPIPEPPSVSASAVPLAAAGALIDVLKVDTEIRGLTLEADSGALAHAVAGALNALQIEAYIPSEATLPAGFEDAPIVLKWKTLGGVRGKLAGCRARLAAADNKAEVAVVDTILVRIDAFASRALVSTTGAAPIVRAVLLETLSAESPVILRVTAEAAGGTMIKRSNLWTAFGALGVRVTGGLLASYRYVDPSTGRVLKDGLLVCRTQLARLSVVQKGDFIATCGAVPTR